MFDFKYICFNFFLLRIFYLRTRSFFSSIPYDLENNQEKHYQTIFYLLFRLMGQYVDAEVKSAVGRADVVIKMQEAIYVFEFKVDGTPEEALAQINSKQYGKRIATMDNIIILNTCYLIPNTFKQLFFR